MAKTGVEQTPSDTAMFAALRRAIANKDYKNAKLGPDHLAEYFLPTYFRFFLKIKPIRANARRRLDTYFPGLTEYMIARTAYFDRLFVEALDSETPQIVLLGAGYDTRAYRFARSNRRTRIYELDVPTTQARKIECLRKARLDIPDQVRFVPINFNQESLAETLAKAGCRSDLKTLFIWEGVTYYLEQEAVEATLEFISQVAQPGSAIAFDYTVSLSEGNKGRYYGAEEFAQTMKAYHANEALLFSIHEGEIEKYLLQRGLRMLNHLDNEEIESTFLQAADGSSIGKNTGHFRFVLAAPC